MRADRDRTETAVQALRRSAGWTGWTEDWTEGGQDDTEAMHARLCRRHIIATHRPLSEEFGADEGVPFARTAGRE